MPVSDHRPAPVSQQSLPHLSALSHYERRFRDPRSGGYTASFAERSFRHQLANMRPPLSPRVIGFDCPGCHFHAGGDGHAGSGTSVRAVSQLHSLTALRSWLRRPVCIAVLLLRPEAGNPSSNEPGGPPTNDTCQADAGNPSASVVLSPFPGRVTPRLTNPETRPRMTHDRPTRVTRLHRRNLDPRSFTASQFHSSSELASSACLHRCPTTMSRAGNPSSNDPETRPRLTHARPTRVTRPHPSSSHRL